MAPKQRLLTCALLYVKFLANIQVSKALTVQSNLVCFSMCTANQACRAHRYLANETTNNCELVLKNNPYAFLIKPFWTIMDATEQSEDKLIVKRSQKVVESEIYATAALAGYDVQLQLATEILFLKQVTTSMRIENAHFECLKQGGILPLEDSDEFIDKMSALVGDSSSTRFTSLVREVGLDPNQPHLVWQTGRVETTVVGPSHPKYTTWNQRYFVVNPTTKTFESVPGTTAKSQFFCQYLGENLALNKTTYPSSIQAGSDVGPGVVDGVIGMTNWQANEYSTLAKHWFAVDLGGEFLVSQILFVGRRDCCGFMKVWIGNVVPPADQLLDYGAYQLCGEYPFIHGIGYSSGISCVEWIRGQIVILENGNQAGVDTVFQLTEVLIF